MSDHNSQTAFPGTGAPTPKEPVSTSSKSKKILLGSSVGLLVVIVIIVLVVVLIVQPNQRAASNAVASASAQAQAQQDQQAAVDAFNSAAKACTTANQALSSAVTSAEQVAQTDPSTMQDPTLLNALSQAITTAQSAAPCVVPTISDDPNSIKQQTTQLATDTDTVATATSALSLSSASVTASVQAKQNAAAQASAAASASVYAAAHTATWTSTDPNGYKAGFTITVSNFVNGSNQAALDAAWRSSGGSGSFPDLDGQEFLDNVGIDIKSATGAFAVGKMTYQNQSSAQFQAQDFGNGHVSVDAGTPSRNVTPTGDDFGILWCQNSSCEPTGANTVWTPTNSFSVMFVLYLHSVFVPNTPTGNPGHGATVPVRFWSYQDGGHDSATLPIPVDW